MKLKLLAIADSEVDVPGTLGAPVHNEHMVGLEFSLDLDLDDVVSKANGVMSMHLQQLIKDTIVDHFSQRADVIGDLEGELEDVTEAPEEEEPDEPEQPDPESKKKT